MKYHKGQQQIQVSIDLKKKKRKNTTTKSIEENKKWKIQEEYTCIKPTPPFPLAPPQPPHPPPPRPLGKQHVANERPSFSYTYLKSTNIKGEPLFNFSEHNQQRGIKGSLSNDDGDTYI